MKQIPDPIRTSCRPDYQTTDMDKLARQIVQYLEWGTTILKPYVLCQLRNFREAALRQRPPNPLMPRGPRADEEPNTSPAPQAPAATGHGHLPKKSRNRQGLPFR